jgi:hypothetical protein
MKKQLYPAALLLSALLPVGAQAQLIAYEGFTQGTGNPALAGYSGTSEIGLSGTWSSLGGQSMTIRDGSGGQWGTPQPNWPVAEHTAWWLTQATRSMSSTLNFTTDGTYYLSYLVQSDQSNNGSQVGFVNTAGTQELMAGLGYSGASDKGVTAYYGSLGGSVQQNGNGTDVAGWSGMNQYQVVAEFTRASGDLSVTLNYYLGAYGGTLESTRTVDLGLVSDSFNTLTFKADGWVNMDEIRIGTTLADVTPVPEPSVAALGGLGILLLMEIQRRFARE